MPFQAVTILSSQSGCSRSSRARHRVSAIVQVDAHDLVGPRHLLQNLQHLVIEKPAMARRAGARWRWTAGTSADRVGLVRRGLPFALCGGGDQRDPQHQVIGKLRHGPADRVHLLDRHRRVAGPGDPEPRILGDRVVGVARGVDIDPIRADGDPIGTVQAVDLWVARAWRDARLFRIGGGATEVVIDLSSVPSM